MFFAICSQKMYLLPLKYHVRLSGRMDNDHKSQKLANAQNRRLPIRLKDAIVAKCLPFTLNTEPQDYVIFSLFQT